MTDSTIKTAEGVNFTAVNIGPLNGLLNGEYNGKVFLKDAVKSGGAEVSFAQVPAGSNIKFFHTHKQNEEIYIVVKGKGEMYIDDKIFPLSEGSVVRVAPSAKRAVKSAADSELIYIVLQVKENSLEQWSMTDGVIL